MVELYPSATTEQSTDVNDVQTNSLNNKRRSNPFPPHCLSAHIGLEYSISIKYGIVKMFVKHIRYIILLFGHRRVGSIGLN